MNIINVILSAAISSTLATFSINNIVKQKLTFKIIIKFLSIMLTLGVITCIFFEGVTRITLTIIITSFALYISMFPKDISKSIYYSIIHEILAFIGEILLSILFLVLLKFDLNKYETFSFSILLFSVSNCLFIYLVTKIKFVKKIVIKLYNRISKNSIEWVYFIVVILLMILLLTFNRYNLNFNLEFFINIMLFLFVLISLLYVIHNKFQKDNYELKYNEMMEYVQKYEKIINNQGKKNHEYNNQLMVIKGYVNNKKKLEEYLDLIINEHKCGQNYTIRELSYFPDGGIKGLIYHKISKMEENNIKYYIYVDKNIKNIFEDKLDIKTYQDITKLLGVFLDNAIEATKDANVKEIELDIKKDDNSIIITISNTYDQNMDLKQIGKKGFTTKGVGHGYGLSIVKDISKHNENIDTYSEVDNDKFNQIILLYYKK